jgi:coenzyme F420-reducing hydrogenase alpha subunit
MVGSLARMNLNQDALHANTKKDAAKYISMFPSDDIYLNNLAQAIEILHSIDHSIDIIEHFEPKPEPPVKLTPQEGKGVGVIEAPRGTLYHFVSLTKEGMIKDAEIVVPTAQNQFNIENDIRHLVQNYLDKEGANFDQEKVRMEIEQLIRAYDPCMSCATHFLKIKWKIS